MTDQLLTLFRFNRSYLDMLMADVAEEQMEHQPAEGMNPPAWIVGHLAFVHDSGRAQLGQDRLLDPDWKRLFGPGSVPAPEGGFPAKGEILDGFAATTDGLASAVEAVDFATLSDPNPSKRLRPVLPTRGDLIAHMMTTHFSTHLGQLSVWRRLMGNPPLI